LQCVAVGRSPMKYSGAEGNPRLRVALCCSMFLCVAVCCSVLQQDDIP